MCCSGNCSCRCLPFDPSASSGFNVALYFHTNLRCPSDPERLNTHQTKKNNKKNQQPTRSLPAAATTTPLPSSPLRSPPPLLSLPLQPLFAVLNICLLMESGLTHLTHLTHNISRLISLSSPHSGCSDILLFSSVCLIFLSPLLSNAQQSITKNAS